MSQNPHDGEGRTYELFSIKKAVVKFKGLGIIEVARAGRPVVFQLKTSSSKCRFNTTPVSYTHLTLPTT